MKVWAASNSFVVKEGIIYYRVHRNPYDRDYYSFYNRVFMADYDGNSLGEIRYRFDKEVYDVFKYNEVIYAIEGLTEKNIIYLEENEKWKILTEQVRAYCFNDEYLYYVIDDITRQRAYHVFYKMNIKSKEIEQLYEISFETSGVSSNGDGFMEKIEVKDGKIYYTESNRSYGREKILDLKGR